MVVQQGFSLTSIIKLCCIIGCIKTSGEHTGFFEYIDLDIKFDNNKRNQKLPHF